MTNNKLGGFSGRKHSEETKQKMRESQLGVVPWNKGIPMSKYVKNKLLAGGREYWSRRESKERASKEKIGELNPQWKGDDVGYTALHEWVKNHLPQSSVCDDCGEEKPLDLANKSNNYLRELSDWEWLCRKCHMIKDGRLETLIQNAKKYRESRL